MAKINIKSFFTDIILAVVIVVSISIFIKPTIVSGESMEPALNDGDYLFLSRQAYHIGNVERNQIVVFPVEEDNDKLYIKRVVGLPGDRVKIQEGQLYVNGTAVDQSFTKDGCTPGDMQEITVPDGKIFVLGDNRANSTDSRVIGSQNIEDVTGVVFVRLWSLNGIGRVQ